LIHVGQENKGEGDVETLGTRIVHMALDFAGLKYLFAKNLSRGYKLFYNNLSRF